VTVNITGSNDNATITASVGEDTGAIEAGGAANATPGDPSASGTLTVHDVDSGESVFAAVPASSLAGTYGDFTFDSATGVWSYTLDQSKADALTAGQSVSDSLSVDSLDTTASRTITVNITGSNDAATIAASISEDTSVKEDVAANHTAGGQLTVSDVDTGEAMFQAPVTLAGAYGDFAFDAGTGAWSYTLGDAKAETQALGEGVTEIETLTVQSADGTASYDIEVTVTGSNDAPVVTSGATGSVAENSSPSTVVYTATSTDLDLGDTITWSLGGADAAAFSIAANGEVRLNAPANFEAKPSYDISVIANDGTASVAKAVAIQVTDVNEAPTAVLLTPVLTAIDENTSTASHIKVADIAISDDALGTNVLSLSGADATNFEIVGNSLYLKAGVVLDYEAQTSYAVDVKVDDAAVGGSPDASQSFALGVNNPA
jgi:VCBS repeat-containing protein